MAIRTGETVRYLLGDHLGSTSLVADASGVKYSELRYQWRSTSASSTNTSLRYTGQRSEGIGLYDYRARWYDPALGRFAQADSVVPMQSQGVQAWDRYAGMNNNPVRYNDPSGHDVGCAGSDASACTAYGDHITEADVQGAIVTGEYGVAIDYAIRMYGLDVSYINGTPTYDSNLTAVGQTYPDRTVILGETAFGTPGWLASTIGHEAVHANQMATGRSYYNTDWSEKDPQGMAVNEVEAYDWEIANAERFGFSPDQLYEERDKNLFTAWNGPQAVRLYDYSIPGVDPAEAR